MFFFSSDKSSLLLPSRLDPRSKDKLYEEVTLEKVGWRGVYINITSDSTNFIDVSWQRFEAAKMDFFFDTSNYY